MAEQERTTREQILSAARCEFMEKGYRGAGLRQIAGKAGVTTGALYGYFKNKEDLFSAIVKTPYNRLLELYREILDEFFALSPQDQPQSLRSFSQRGMEVMSEYLYDHYDAFRLILCRSEGTPYCHLVEEMAGLDLTATHDFEDVSAGAGMPLKPVHPMLERMLTASMFSTFFDLIIREVPRTEKDVYITQLLEFYTGGWSTVMGLS